MKGYILFYLLIILFCCCASTVYSKNNHIKDNKCSLHNVELVEEELPVLYGLVNLEKSYLEIKRKNFPNYDSKVLGGCVVTPIKFKMVKICPECKKAYWEYISKSK